MGRKSQSGGVRAKSANRIEYRIWYEGHLYRPSLEIPSNTANLKRAAVHLAQINERIRAGTFSFRDEFPQYRYGDALTPEPNEVIESPGEKLCDQVFDEFLKYCEVRVLASDMAYSTYESYRNILKHSWRPKLGKRAFLKVKYSDLLEIATAQGWKTKKTYNNGVSPMRCAFEHEYKNHQGFDNPAELLEGFRIKKKDRPEVDPFTVEEAEAIIAGVHTEFGEAAGNFDELRFFSGLRQSEQLGLRVSRCDLVAGKILITEVVVLGRDKDRTKTAEDRIVKLCPRGLAVLKRQFALRDLYVAAGKIDHDYVFFRDDGQRLRALSYPYRRWTHVFDKLQVRYREPYNARHSYATWLLMTGHNLGWAAEQLGDSLQMFCDRYAKWITGSTQTDVAAIEQAMQAEPTGQRLSGSDVPRLPSERRQCAKGEGWGRLSWRKVKQQHIESEALPFAFRFGQTAGPVRARTQRLRTRVSRTKSL